MTNGHAQRPKSVPVLAIAIGLASLLFAVAIGVVVFLLVRPRGERVGELSLTQPGASLSITAAAGATLVFRSDVEIALPRLSLVSDDVVERRVDKQLRSSTLTVRATGSSGAERSATCAVYNGRAMTTTIISGTLSRSGMLNDCVISLDSAGPWQVSAGVTWAPELELRAATLETRLEAAAR